MVPVFAPDRDESCWVQTQRNPQTLACASLLSASPLSPLVYPEYSGCYTSGARDIELSRMWRRARGSHGGNLGETFPNSDSSGIEFSLVSANDTSSSLHLLAGERKRTAEAQERRYPYMPTWPRALASSYSRLRQPPHMC